MDSNIKTTTGPEISVISNNSSTSISIIDSHESIIVSENEYDSIDDFNQIDFSQKQNSDINGAYLNNEESNNEANGDEEVHNEANGDSEVDDEVLNGEVVEDVFEEESNDKEVAAENE